MGSNASKTVNGGFSQQHLFIMAGIDIQELSTRGTIPNNASIRGIVVSDEVFYYFSLINFWGPGQAVCIFGIVTNVLNIIVFAKQGVRDTVNISLLGLATSDLGSQITLMYANINVTPLFAELDLPFVASDAQYITSLCHIMFTRVSAWITAYITLERCVCVTMPLKVKQLFTPKRTVVYLQCVYILMVACMCPCFITLRSVYVFDPLRNKTVLGLSFVENREAIEHITIITQNTVPTVGLCLIIVCTAFLVSAVRQKSKWRKQASSASGSAAMSGRDDKVIKMVVLISIIFIICYLPSAVFMVYLFTDSDTRFDGPQKNLMVACFSILFHLESLNAGVNIFIYLNMSSKFRSTFKKTFCFRC